MNNKVATKQSYFCRPTAVTLGTPSIRTVIVKLSLNMREQCDDCKGPLTIMETFPVIAIQSTIMEFYTKPYPSDVCANGQSTEDRENDKPSAVENLHQEGWLLSNIRTINEMLIIDEIGNMVSSDSIEFDPAEDIYVMYRPVVCSWHPDADKVRFAEVAKDLQAEFMEELESDNDDNDEEPD